MPPKKAVMRKPRNIIGLAEVRRRAKAGSLDADTLVRIQSSWQQWSLTEIGEVETLLRDLDPDAAEEVDEHGQPEEKRRRKVKTATQKQANALPVEARWYVVFDLWPRG